MANAKISLSEASHLFSSLADTNRLRILMLLAAQELFVCEMSRLLNMPQPTLSNHLSVLRRNGLVSSTTQGRWRLYSLGDLPSQVKRLLAELLDDPVIRADMQKLQKYLASGRDICGTRLNPEEKP